MRPAPRMSPTVPSAIGSPLQRIELGEERLQRRRVAVDPAAARQRVGEGDPPPDEQHQLAGVEPQGGARALAAIGHGDPARGRGEGPALIAGDQLDRRHQVACAGEEAGEHRRRMGQHRGRDLLIAAIVETGGPADVEPVDEELAQRDAHREAQREHPLGCVRREVEAGGAELVDIVGGGAVRVADPGHAVLGIGLADHVELGLLELGVAHVEGLDLLALDRRVVPLLHAAGNDSQVAADLVDRPVPAAGEPPLPPVPPVEVPPLPPVPPLPELPQLVLPVLPLLEAPWLPLIDEPPELVFWLVLAPGLRIGTKMLLRRLVPLRTWFWPPRALLRSLLSRPLRTPQRMPFPPVALPPEPPFEVAPPPLPPCDDELAPPPWVPCEPELVDGLEGLDGLDGDEAAKVVTVIAEPPMTAAAARAAKPSTRMNLPPWLCVGGSPCRPTPLTLQGHNGRAPTVLRGSRGSGGLRCYPTIRACVLIGWAMPASSGPATTPLSWSWPISPSPSPRQPARISSVCSPRSGARRTSTRCSAPKSSGEPGMR